MPMFPNCDDMPLFSGTAIQVEDAPFTPSTPTPPQWGHNKRHDRAMRVCIASRNTCPFGCDKSGGPNCAYHVHLGECDPARQTI